MSKYKILIILSFLLVCHSIPAESFFYNNEEGKTAFISGKIYDDKTSGDNQVRHATVCLISGKDSVWTTTSELGIFSFKNIAPGKITIKASLVGYKPVTGEYEVVGGENIIFLTMSKDLEYLNAAKVTAEGEFVKMKGDTTIFNTRLLTAMEGDNAAELFLQLPGASMSNGKVLMNGKQIKRTYINGVLVYGNDPSSALHSLLAREVTSMKVYEEDSIEDRKHGRKHGRKETVLDIETQEAIVSAIDLHALASGGVDQTPKRDGRVQPRYGAGVTGNFYSEMFLASLNAFADNINRGSNVLSSITSANGGLNQYNEKAHIDTRMEKYWKDRLMGSSVRLAYSFDRDFAENNSTSKTDYFATDEAPAIKYSDRSNSSSVTKSHYAEFLASINNDIIKTLDIMSIFGYNSTCSANTWITESQTSDNILMQNQESQSDNDSWYSDNFIGWSGYGLSEHITPKLEASCQFRHNEGNSWTTDTLASSFNKRELVSEMAGSSQLYSVMPSLNIMLRNDDKMTTGLDFTYRYTYDKHTDLKSTLDYWKTDTPRIDYSNTFDYTYRTHNHWARARWNLNTSSLQLEMGITGVMNKLTDHKTVPDEFKTSKSYLSILPHFVILIKKYSFSYGTDYILPSIEQVRYQMDDSNPLMLRIGNPELKKSFLHRFQFAYDTFTRKRHTWIVRLNAEYVSNSIVSKSRYFDSQEIINIGYDYTVNQGSTLYTYANANGAINVTGYTKWSARLKRIKSSLSIDFGTNYKRAPIYVGNQLVMLSEVNPFVTINPTINPAKWIRLSIYSRSNLVHSTNNLKERIAFAYNQNLTGNLNLIGPKATFANLGYTWNSYRYFKGTGKDMDTHNLNAVIGIKLLKDQMTVSFSGHDLLNSGSIYTMSTSSNYLSQTWTPSYGRYFMLNISFRLNRLGKNVRSMGRMSDGSANSKIIL